MITLFYDPCFDRVTGAQRSLLTLVAACRERGETVIVVSQAEGPLLAAARDAGAHGESLGAPALVRRWSDGHGIGAGLLHRLVNIVLLPWVLLRAWRILWRRRPELVCLNTAGGALYFGWPARLLGIPVIWFQRLMVRQPLLFALAGRVADRIVLVSEDLQAAFSRTQLARWRDRMTVLPTGFAELSPSPDSDREAEARIAAEQGQALPPTRPRFVVLGSWSPRKGQDDAVRALAAYRAAGGRGILILCGHIGAPAWREEVRALAAREGVADAVVELRETAHPAALLQACDVLLLPSRAEGLPRVVVEALATGRPVLAYPVSGVRELLREPVCGQVLERPDPAALARAMQALPAGDAEAAARRRRAVAHLSVERHVTGFLAIRRALERR